MGTKETPCGYTLKTLATGNDPLLGLLYTFNVLPARYIHPDRCKELALDFDLIKGMGTSFRVQKSLSRIILAETGLLDDYCFGLPGPFLCALLESTELEDLALLAGAALHARQIGRIIHKKELERVKEAIGERAYTFALKKAPLLIGEAGLALSGKTGFDNPADVLVRSGVDCLRACFYEAPPSLTLRMALKFSNGLHSHWKETQTLEYTDGQSKGAAVVIRKILSKEMRPAWETYCT